MVNARTRAARRAATTLFNRRGNGIGAPRFVVARQPQRAPGTGLSKSARRRRAVANGNHMLPPTTLATHVTAPVSMGYRPGPMGKPVMTKSANGPMIICHKEYVTDVIATAVYTPVSFNINPGLATLFPWLSTVASSFEKYKFRYCRFVYEPECSTATGGSLMMSVDLDALDPMPLSKVAIMAVKDAQRSPLWSSCVTMIPESVVELYVRSGNPPTTSDLKTYDAGKLTVATSGAAPAGPAGELYVEYCVELHVPQLPVDTPASMIARPATTVSNTNLFGATGASTKIRGSLQVSFLTNTFSIACDAGSAFSVIFAAIYTGGPVTAMTADATVGTISELIDSPIFNTNTVTDVLAFNVVTTDIIPSGILAGRTGVSITYTITATTLASIAANSFTIIITQIEPNLALP